MNNLNKMMTMEGLWSTLVFVMAVLGLVAFILYFTNNKSCNCGNNGYTANPIPLRLPGCDMTYSCGPDTTPAEYGYGKPTEQVGCYVKNENDKGADPCAAMQSGLDCIKKSCVPNCCPGNQ